LHGKEQGSYSGSVDNARDWGDKMTELHTDSYTAPSVEVLRHTARNRVALLRDNGQTRSVAITLFPRWPSVELAAVNEVIRRNALMGKTFRDHGFAVRQNRLWLSAFGLPSRLKQRLDFTPEQRLAVEVYEFYGDTHLYGTVVEFALATAHLPDRPSHGRMAVWRFFGQGQQFFDCLQGAVYRGSVRSAAKCCARVVAWFAIIRTLRTALKEVPKFKHERRLS